MSEPQRAEAAAQRWCQIKLGKLQGWILNNKLREAGPVIAPSFACDVEKLSQVEKLICNDPDLMARDQKMAAVFQEALSKAQALDAGASQAAKTLQAYQRGWIKGRDECWKAGDGIKTCVQETYDRRTAALVGQWMLAKPYASYRDVCEQHASQ